MPTEDDFLRLEDMERFVQDAEEAAMRDNASEEDQEGDDEGDDDDDDDDDDLGKPSIFPGKAPFLVGNGKTCTSSLQ